MRSPILMRLPGLAKAFQRSGADAHVKRCRDLLAGSAVAITDAFELGGNDLGVVENQRVPCPQERRKIADSMIAEDSFGSADRRRAGARCRAARRPQRDPFIRQIEIEKVYAHQALSGKAKPAPALSAQGRVSAKSQSDVGGNPHGDDGVRIADRFAALDRVDDCPCLR